MIKHSRVIIIIAVFVLCSCTSVTEYQAVSNTASVAGVDTLLPEMVVIPAGSFTMGDAAEEGDANELPLHQVSVSSFSLAKTEVTYALYDYFAEQTGRDTTNDEGWGRGPHPVTNVTWLDANALVTWLRQETGRAFRLPSEAEWEFAARAGKDTVFPSGNTITREYANYGPSDCCAKGTGTSGVDQWEYTAPVGSFKPNPLGLYDMLGNVWEWTSDCWNETYDGAPTDGSSWQTGDCTRSPLRGGSWSHYSRNIRPANRNENLRAKSSNGYGIRLAEDLGSGE